MYGMHLSDGKELSKLKASKLETIIKTAFILATVIKAEVANIKACFLAFRAVNI